VHCGNAAYDRAMSRAADLRRLLLARRAYVLQAAVALILVFLSVPVDRPTGVAAADLALAVWWIFTAVMVVGLLIQHRWPLLALLLASIGAAAHTLALDPVWRVGFPTLIDLAVPITLYTLASRTRSRRISVAALAVLVVAEFAVSLINPMMAAERPAQTAGRQATVSQESLGAAKKPTAVEQPSPSLVRFSPLQNKFVKPGLSALLALALAFAFGDGARTRRAHLRTLQQRAIDLEHEQQQRVALATATERARIGRELHDVIAHSLSVIVAQTQAAVAAQRRHPERANQAMREVITVGRDSLSEMRRLIGAFEPTPSPDQTLSPQPGIAALPALVDRVRAAGTPVRLEVDGPPAWLPAGVDLAAYRIVQEALTNTLKHAGPGAEASVHLAVRAEYVDVEVTNDGAGRPAAPASGHGNGLRGIAERVDLLGGRLMIEPDPDGGFTVRARLPIPPDHATRPDEIGVPE
jgi:signal transduction histidine kinase